MSSVATTSVRKPTSDERRANLARVVASDVGSGWRVESQTEYQAVIVKGHRPNHVLHLILSIVTLGIWLPVWIGVSIFSGEKRRAVSVDEFGNVVRQ